MQRSLEQAARQAAAIICVSESTRREVIEDLRAGVGLLAAAHADAGHGLGVFHGPADLVDAVDGLLDDVVDIAAGVSAAGNIELSSQRPVVLEVDTA